VHAPCRPSGGMDVCTLFPAAMRAGCSQVTLASTASVSFFTLTEGQVFWRRGCPPARLPPTSLGIFRQHPFWGANLYRLSILDSAFARAPAPGCLGLSFQHRLLNFSRIRPSILEGGVARAMASRLPQPYSATFALGPPTIHRIRLILS